MEKLVESGTVVKVDYKGNVSYRNTAKWKKTHSWKKVVHSDKTCKNIISAVQEIAQNSLERGASVKDVEKWLSTNTQGPQIERTQLRAALDKEVVNGNLKKLPQGTYISSESNPEKKITEKPTTSVSSPGKRGRPPSKRKKFKKTHGPDFETLSFGKRSMDDASCDYCLQTEPIVRRGFKEGILVCQDCNAKDGNNTSCLPTPYDSAASSEDDNNRIEAKRKSEERSPPEQKKSSCPDASRWGVEDVVKYFSSLGYKDQADALQDQEIDGQSLLLMKRSDVLTGLSIRLGPALKMYQHVMKLQLGGMDTAN